MTYAWVERFSHTDDRAVQAAGETKTVSGEEVPDLSAPQTSLDQPMSMRIIRLAWKLVIGCRCGPSPDKDVGRLVTLDKHEMVTAINTSKEGKVIRLHAPR